MDGGAGVDVSGKRSTANEFMQAESHLIVLVHDGRGDLMSRNLLEEGKFLSFSGHDEL